MNPNGDFYFHSEGKKESEGGGNDGEIPFPRPFEQRWDQKINCNRECLGPIRLRQWPLAIEVY